MFFASTQIVSATLRYFAIPALICLYLFLPEMSLAQGFVSCNGPDCSACNLVDMGNTILQWLIGVLMVVFAVLLAVAGFGLVTSGGNPSALQTAKDRMTNAIIGLIIVLCAWLIVDTVMRALLNPVGPSGPTAGYIQGWGPWSEVRCQSQVVTHYAPESRTDDTLASGPWSDPTGTNTLGPLGPGNEGVVDFAEQMMAQGCIYNQALRNACQGNPGYTDCSDLVNAAYQAAGGTSPGTYTGNMITNAEPIGSPSTLRPGDALIHRTNGAGHVVICKDVGCNTVIHAAGTGRNIVEGNGANFYGDSRYQVIRANNFGL